ncbi:hypothetical protein PPERSA_07313 [Pseudocohnilembus persalinus]|uniref:PCI domain-containing protein n=1 Tax=Pseudocohnilembus persalinus TaxID=266149 RepID=A0A0V0R6U6_PSEPJ|nr:hypothetical protein PPERSA_07313 [Pseudocohnilembus persalinus]|eukprot:KRX10228.1 hypothetical protein PPERSA_07313 [Pseudocohnilembus persalinus]
MSSQSEVIERFKILVSTQNYNTQVLAGVVQDIIKNPRIFQFTEILQLKSIKDVLGYELLKLELQINNDQEIDDLLIESIYQDLIQGKINQAERVFKVSSCISRDVREIDVNEIKNRLQQIYNKNQDVQKQLQQRIEQVNYLKKQDLERKKQYQQEQDNAQAQAQKMNKK